MDGIVEGEVDVDLSRLDSYFRLNKDEICVELQNELQRRHLIGTYYDKQQRLMSARQIGETGEGADQTEDEKMKGD